MSPCAAQSSHVGCSTRSAEHLSCDCTADAMRRKHLAKSPCATPLNQTFASEPLSRRRLERGRRTDSQDPMQQVIAGHEDPLRKVISRLPPERSARTRFRPSTGSTGQTESPHEVGSSHGSSTSRLSPVPPDPWLANESS